MSLFILLGILITAGSLLYIFYPLILTSNFTMSWESASPLKLLLHQKQTIYENIKDLEFEYQMGKLSEEDFQKLREDFTREAVNVMQQIDELQPQTLERPGEKKIISVLAENSSKKKIS
jgi:hypothetical protein